MAFRFGFNRNKKGRKFSFSSLFDKIKQIFNINTPKKKTEDQNVEPKPQHKKTEETEQESAQIIIDNFKKTIEKMADDDYTIKFGHNFPSTPNTPENRSASGQHAKNNAKEDVLMKLEEVLNTVDEVTVAKNIMNNGIYLEELVESLVFAIYDDKYSKHGGGRGAYNMALYEFMSYLTFEEKGATD